MLNIDNSLVLMIDFQEKLIKATNADTDAALKMINAANILEIPVIASEQYPKGLGATSENIREQFNQNTIVIEKTAFSLLQEENTIEKIKSFNKKQIILFGIETHICVLQTAIELLENGFEVYVIKNACKSRKEYEYLSGLETMKDNGANIITLEIALFQLLKTSKHPKFKEIQNLIK